MPFSLLVFVFYLKLELQKKCGLQFSLDRKTWVVSLVSRQTKLKRHPKYRYFGNSDESDAERICVVSSDLAL